MSNLFSIDRRTLAKIDKFASQFPKDFQYAAAAVMSNQAFEARQSIIDTIDDQMEVRSPAFVKRQVRFDKADPRSPISRQFSVAGSVRTKRFSGWVEQQTGKKSDKDQNITISGARDGSYGNKVPDAFRLKEGRIFTRQENYMANKFKTKGQRTVAMIRDAKRGRLNRPFILDKDLPVGTDRRKGRTNGSLSRFKYGLYTVNNGNVTRVQNFEKRMSYTRMDWMGMSLNRNERKFNLDKAWSKQLDYRLKRKQKR